MSGVFSKLPTEVIVRMLLQAEVADTLSFSLTCKSLRRLVVRSVELRYTECLHTCGMADGTYSGSQVSLSERINILRDNMSSWRTLAWKTEAIALRPHNSDHTRFRASNDVVVAYSTIVGGKTTLIEVYRIHSATRRIDSKYIKWSVPFRVSSAVVDGARDLLLLFQEVETRLPRVDLDLGEQCRERPHLIHARTLDGLVYPSGQHGLHVEEPVPIEVSHAQMESCPSICGNYLLWKSEVSTYFGTRHTPLYDWTEGYEVTEADNGRIDEDDTVLVFLDDTHVALCRGEPTDDAYTAHSNALRVYKINGSRLRLTHIFELPFNGSHCIETIRAVHDARPVSIDKAAGLFSLTDQSLLRFSLEISYDGLDVSNLELVLYNQSLHRHMRNYDAYFSVDGVVAVPWEVWGRSGVALGVRSPAPKGYHNMWIPRACGVRLLSYVVRLVSRMEVFDFHPGRTRAARSDDARSDDAKQDSYVLYDGPVVLEAKFTNTGEDILTYLPFTYSLTATPIPIPESTYSVNIWPRAEVVFVEPLLLAEDGVIQLKLAQGQRDVHRRILDTGVDAAYIVSI